MPTPKVCLPVEAMPIEEWFFAQDRAVEEEMKVVRRNKLRRRSLDRADIEVRTAKRIREERAEFGRLLAIARAIYRMTSSKDGILSFGYGLVSGSHTNSDVREAYEEKYGAKLDDYDLGPLSHVGYQHHADRVRREIVAEMNQELKERLAAKPLQKSICDAA